jgi:hypothetical protein
MAAGDANTGRQSEGKRLMPKKRGRKSSNRVNQDTLIIRRGHRTRFVIISVLTAIASIALLVAGFLNFAEPTPQPAVTTTVVAPTAPQGAARLPPGITITKVF